MKKTFLPLAALPLLAIAACGETASDEDLAATGNETLVDEDYDDSAPTLDEAMDELGSEDTAETGASSAPPQAQPQPTPEVTEDDVMTEDPETDDVSGM